jgi:hypothetical protein
LIKLARGVNLNIQAITLNIVENLSKVHEEADTTMLLSTTINNTTANATLLNRTEFASMRTTQSLNEVRPLPVLLLFDA